jgi:hypothetical protein
MASQAVGKNVVSGLKSSESFARTRFLLALWDLGITDIKKSEVLKRTKKTGEKTTDYDPIILQLEKDGAIALSGSKISLLQPAGSHLLNASLKSADFSFDTSVGAKTANALLNWIRQMETVSTASSRPTTVKLTSYEAFKPVVLEVFDRLNRDYNMGNMVPIYRIRRDIGDQVSRSQFSEWLFQMQSEDLLELLEEGVEDGASDKIEDSVTTKLGKLRCYARQV